MKKNLILLVAAVFLAPLALTSKGGESDGVRAILMRHCAECHAIEKPKGDFRVDRLSTDFADSVNRERWQNLLKRVQAGEMPPKSKPRLAEDDVRALTEWVAHAEKSRRGGGRVVLRRLNRNEYENTIRD